MRLLLASTGSEGDIRPFYALAKGHDGRSSSSAFALSPARYPGEKPGPPESTGAALLARSGFNGSGLFAGMTVAGRVDNSYVTVFNICEG